MVTEIVDLDLGSNSSFKIVTMEGDIRSRFIEFHLSYNGEVFNLQNKSVKCRYVNGKTTEEVNLVVNDRANGVCTLEIPYRITSSAQNRKCELVISQSGELLSTIPFVVEVVKSLVERATVESSNEFGALTNALWKIDGVDNRLNSISSQLDNKANKDDVAKISSGTPLFASCIGEMTDTTKNYVNTSDGYLYTYTGSEFEKSNVKYQETGLSDKQVTTKKLSDDVRISPHALINLDKNLIDINYLNEPLSFIDWYNSASTTINEDSLKRINNFKTINIQSSSRDTHWNMSVSIPYAKQGKITFSYLRKASVLNGQNVNAVDNDNKWYGGKYEVIDDYYKGWDLVKYTITINTDITSIKFYIGNYNGENNYNVGLFSLVEGEYIDILPKWTFQDLSEDVQSLITKQASEYEIKNLGGLINESYSLNPLSFISWNNTNSSTIKNNRTILMNYQTLNVITNLNSGTHYLNSINIKNPTKSKYTFSCLMKLNSGVKPFIDVMDNNNKYYKSNGGITTITENYYKDYSLLTFTFDVTTDITKLVVLIGYTGASNFDIGMFSLWEGVKQLEIINRDTVTYEKLDNELKSKINKIGVNTLDVLDYDMLLPKKIFMINEEPLRLYKKNIVVNADNIRDLELSVTSYTDDDFWNNSKQPYVEYINDKLELNSDNIMGKKIKFNLVGNDLKTRLVKEVEVVSRSKSEVGGKNIVVNMFGDSTSQNGLTYAVNKLLSHYVTRKLIGTKTINGAPAEARGGWLYQQYIGYRTTYSHNDLPINKADYPNFLKVATAKDKTNKGDWCFTRTGSSREKTYNEIVAEGGDTSQNFYIFDYAHYLQINGFENPDFVTLGMGINDYWKYPNDATELCERALNIIIKQIHEASPNTKFILQPFPTKGSNDVKSEWFKKCLELETYFRDTVGVNIEIVAEHLSQNKDLFFPTTVTSLDHKVANKEVINDDIHTTYAGYSEGARPIVYCILNKID